MVNEKRCECFDEIVEEVLRRLEKRKVTIDLKAIAESFKQVGLANHSQIIEGIQRGIKSAMQSYAASHDIAAEEQ